ncbi:MAG: DEAD/DEAH box helicase [Planctomycetota bacterium]|nr:DEAD/DEAH box helicase [Planctomycetota bacterium]
MYFESEKSPEAPIEAGAEAAVPAEEAPLAAAPEALRGALEKRGFEQLTAVQQSVAQADDGARDLRISSQTGSGKTVAIGFALAAKLVDPARVGPTTLIIAPTRELAMQVREELSWLFAGMKDVRCEVVTGGTNLDRERLRLQRKPSVLVGTPGRLLDHLRRGGLDISSVSQLVLDEADQMLDLGFKDELDGILERLPEQRRTHLVSATFPRAVLELADRFQDEPLLIEGTAPGEAHEDIEHVACRIGPREHYQATVNLLLLAGEERTLVFVRTREETARMADKLAADGFGALPLNGDLAQSQRTRTLNAFRNGSIKVLVATDVAARGIDVPSVTMVIHVDLPIDAATYVHRSGRTGRAGQKGRSVLLVPKVRAGRSHRMFDHIGIEPRWTWPPTAQTIAKKQLERAEAAAISTLTAGAAATPEKRASAANLLQERDPVEVVAMLLSKSITAPRAPFDLLPPQPPAERQDAPRLGNDRRGTPGAKPSWNNSEQEPAKRPERGFVRFRINWGARGGANPRRILAHVCRRGGVDNRQVGSISMSTTSSTFEVAQEIADEFARRCQRRDKRDPHLVIHRETFRGGPGQRFGASRTKQSR